MKTSVPTIGLEMEGVFVKNGQPIRAVNLFGKHVDFKDAYDVCAEVRTYHPVAFNDKSTISYLGKQLLSDMERVSDAAKCAGGDVVWDEMLIPEYIHQDVVRNAALSGKIVHNAITGIDSQAKSRAAGSDDRYRGGGLHINIGSIPKGCEQKLVKMMTATLPHPSSPKERLPFRSAYRARGLWRETEYQKVAGIEYRSPCFSFTPRGIIHFWHLIEGTVSILSRLEKAD